MELHALAIEMPKLARRHPNRVPFTGVLTRVDEPSDRAPAGARGHRVVLTRAAAEVALPSLIGMALDHTPKLDGHDARRKIGIITSADIVGKQIVVSGYVFARDFPELMAEWKRGVKLGMSYEVADARVEDVRAAVWRLVEVTFTGAAVLLRDKAAYSGTSIEIPAIEIPAIEGAAAATKFKSGARKMHEVHMNTEQTQQLITTTERLALAAEALTQSVARIDAQHGEVQSTITRIVAAMESEGEIQARIADLEKENTELRAQISAGAKKPVSTARKTLPPLATSILAKSGIEV